MTCTFSRISSKKFSKRFDASRKERQLAAVLDNRDSNEKLKAWKIEFDKNKILYQRQDPVIFNDEIFKSYNENSNTNFVRKKYQKKKEPKVMFIDDLKLSTILEKWFYWQDDMMHISDLQEISAEELMSRKGFGKKFLHEIKDKLSKFGLRLNETKK